MRESLADSLAIAARHLPSGLVPQADAGRLLRLARRLAPVHCAGFEVRLNGGTRRVDLQQRITPRDAEPARLAAHLRRERLETHPGWRRLAAFMRAWPTHGDLAAIIECWLEFEPDAGRSSPPSLFLSLERSLDAAQGAHACARALALLMPAFSARRVLGVLREIARLLPAGARMFDIGLMARVPAALRVNIGGVAAPEIGHVLAALGWAPVDRERIEVLARAVGPHARHLKLALDWHGGWLPRAGIEILPGADPELPVAAVERERWRRLLGLLHAMRLCDARRAAALLGWPGEEMPPECPLGWPASLILESLVRGPDTFSVLGRRLSHLKIDFVPGRLPAAKAYFGFGRLWRGAPSRRGTRGQASSLRAAIARAASFLLVGQEASGAWRDFGAIREGSNEWVSARVAAALARHGGTAGRRAARAAWTRLRGLRREAGWGYDARFTADADSTSWALRLAATLGQRRAPGLRAARGLLREHRDRQGGVATFLPEALGARPGRVPEALAGWCAAHAEVTAAAGALRGFARSSATWLAGEQRPDGSWHSYWYDEDAFATALAAEHLATRPDQTSRRAAQRAARWAALRIAADGPVAAAGLPGGSAFAGACCLRILLCAPPTDDARRAIERVSAWLLAGQLANGGWRSSAPLRVPQPGDRHPATFGERQGFAWDEKGLFTTATVLEALGALAEQRRSAA